MGVRWKFGGSVVEVRWKSGGSLKSNISIVNIQVPKLEVGLQGPGWLGVGL